MSHDFPEDAAETIQTYLESSEGLLSTMGAEVRELTRERTTLYLEYTEGVTNATDRRSLHGGTLATLIDSAGGIALRPYLDDPVRDGVATVSMNVDYLSAATDDVEATAEVLRVGGTVGVSRVEIEETNNNEQPVAVGRGTYRLFSNED